MLAIFRVEPGIERCCFRAQGGDPDIAYWRIHDGVLWLFCSCHAPGVRRALLEWGRLN